MSKRARAVRVRAKIRACESSPCPCEDPSVREQSVSVVDTIIVRFHPSSYSIIGNSSRYLEDPIPSIFDVFGQSVKTRT